MLSNNKNQILANNEQELNTTIVEEKIIKEKGAVQIRTYYQGLLLGNGVSSKCYEFFSLENEKIFAAKVIPKSSLEIPRSMKNL